MCDHRIGPFPHGSRSGFSQVEVLVGLVLFLLVAGMVGGYYQLNMKASRKSDAWFVSSQLAAAALEEAKGDVANADTLAWLLGEMGDSTFTRKGSVARQGKDYSLSVSFRKVSAGSGLLRIKASVTWDRARGNSMGTVYPYAP